MGWWGSILITIELLSLSLGGASTAWANSSGGRYEHEDPSSRPGRAQNNLVALLPNGMPHHAFNVARLSVMLERARTNLITTRAAVPPLQLIKDGTVHANDVHARLKRLPTQEILGFTVSDYSTLFDALTGEVRDARKPVFTSMASMGPASSERAPASNAPTDNRSLERISRMANGLHYVFLAAQALREQASSGGILVQLPSGVAVRQLLSGTSGGRAPDRLSAERLERAVSGLTLEQSVQIPMQDARDLHSEVRKAVSPF